jgi:hypothetical protein
MARLLWTSYKDRIAKSEVISMQFDLDNMIDRVDGLDDLIDPL